MANTPNPHDRVALLLARGLTLRQISSQAGVGLGTVAEIATGKTQRPSYSTALLIGNVRVPRAKKAKAADRGDIAAIDQITDNTLAKDGLSRPRDDVSMLDALRASAARRYGGRS